MTPARLLLPPGHPAEQFWVHHTKDTPQVLHAQGEFEEWPTLGSLHSAPPGDSPPASAPPNGQQERRTVIAETVPEIQEQACLRRHPPFKLSAPLTW